MNIKNSRYTDDQLITSIGKSLQEKATQKNREVAQRFFKEPIVCHGVMSAEVRKIAQTYWKEVQPWGKDAIFAVCEKLYQTGFMEESFIVSSWVPRLTPQFEWEDITVFRRWIEIYITNWASCDGFCNHSIGNFVGKYPDAVQELKRWSRSGNRWLKRASAVSLIIPARQGKFLKDILVIAETLLTDPDDMVQKGYGWMLKEASRFHEKEILMFVMQHKKEMPRTALRYAIELMSPPQRKQAMM